MKHLQSSFAVKRQRNWLFSGYNISVSCRLVPLAEEEQIPVSAFLEHLLDQSPPLIPHLSSLTNIELEGKKHYIIQDLRGRPGETFADSGIKLSALEDAREEELFYVSGTVFLPLPREKDETEEVVQELPFFYRLTTRFYAYEGSRHILHVIEPSISNGLNHLLDGLSPENLTRSLSLDLSIARIGLEIYCSRSLGWVFGTGPVIQQRQFLEISRNNIQLLLEEERLKGKFGVPAEHSNMLRSIDKTLAETRLFDGLSLSICSICQTA